MSEFDDFVLAMHIVNCDLTIYELVYSFASGRLKDFLELDENGFSRCPPKTQGYFEIGDQARKNLKPYLKMESQEDIKEVFLYLYDVFTRLLKFYRKCEKEKINFAWEEVIKRGWHCDHDFQLFDELQDPKLIELDVKLWRVEI